MSNSMPTVAEVLDPRLKFKADALRAMRRFRLSRPWRGTREQRIRKFNRLNRDLASAYGVPEPMLVFKRAIFLKDGDKVIDVTGCSHYLRPFKMIVVIGKMSVVTYLHEFAHHLLGPDEREACRWSINLFKRCFPKQYAKLQHDGHWLKKEST